MHDMSNPWQKPNSNGNFITAIYDFCMMTSWGYTWFVANIVILTTGVVANAILLWLFLRERKSMSASQVLGMNLVIMNLMYLSIIPVTIITSNLSLSKNSTIPDFSDIISGSQTLPKSSSIPREIRAVFQAFVLIGTPLILTCMCIERHLAVSQPVLYMKIRERKYRLMVSAVVWVITVGFCVTSAFINDTLIMIPISITISFLFVVMLVCLGNMVRSLKLQSPAHHSSLGNQGHNGSPQKRQAVQSLLIVVVSAISVYLPVLALFPLILYIYYTKTAPLPQFVVCNVFETAVLFPCFGVLIGPLFFFSKAKQMFKYKMTAKSG